MPRLTSCSLLMCAIFVVPVVRGQSVNIDYEAGSGTPAENYAAAGLPGVWNALTAPPNVAQPLVGLDGEPIAATVTQLLATGTIHRDDPATSGEDEALMDDFVPGLGDIVVGLTFEGLRDGVYEVITYAWTPNSPNSTTLVGLDENLTGGQLIGGAWPGTLTKGITHASHRTEVQGGRLSIFWVGGHFGADGAINGVQLTFLSLPGDLNCDGRFDGADIDPFFLALVDPKAYQAAFPNCDLLNGDINGDNRLDGADIDPFFQCLAGNCP